MSEPFLSIIIPAYNEERRIGKTLSELRDYLKKELYPFEVIVVSDGSTDKTVSVIDTFTGTLPGLRVIALPKNAGKGNAVKEGMLVAKGQLRLFTDADSATPISEVAILLESVKREGEQGGSDIVIGSLGVSGAMMERTQSRLRMLCGRLSNRLVQWIVLPGIYDTQRGFKLFTKEAAEALFPLMTIRRWGFDIEILALARRLGFSIREVPIRWRHVPESKVTPLSYLQVLGELLLIRFRLSRVNKAGVLNHGK
jgi:dolichyl-phosphate beta-glucosyltransferase